MSTFLSVRIHFIWSTKGREPSIESSWQPKLYAYINGILDNKKSKLLAIGGTNDHIHVYTSLPSTLSIAELANAVKSNSSGWIHETISHAQSFAWQSGYAAFSMSKSADKNVRAYIQNQAEHHRAKTFKEELIEFLDRDEIQYDPRYVFD